MKAPITYKYHILTLVVFLLGILEANAQFTLQAPNSTDETNYRWFEASDTNTVLGTDSSYDVYIPGVYYAVYDGTLCGRNATTYFIVTYCDAPHNEVTLNIADNINAGATISWSPALPGDQLSPVVTATEAMEIYTATVTKAGNDKALPSFTVVCLYEMFDLIDDDVVTNQDTPLNIDMLANDIAIPMVGTLTLTSPVNGVAVINNNGTPVNPSDDFIEYTPNPGFSGTDTFTYTLTLINSDNTTMDDTATITVTVNPDMDMVNAVDDDVVIDTSIALTSINVVDNNDFYDAGPAVLGVNVSITNITDGDTTDDVTLDPLTGEVNITENTPPGNYTIGYTICSIADPSICDSATINITVTLTALVFANDDVNAAPVDGDAGADNILNVLDNDTYNDQPVISDDVIITLMPGNDEGFILLDTTNGFVDVAPSTPPGTYTIMYELCLTADTANCDTAVVTITVNEPVVEDLIVYQLITPNGDGNNDVLIIEGIQNFPRNSVKIFNRWGVAVFETEGYDSVSNNFDGISKGRATVKQGEMLPAGTYYYVIEYVNNNNRSVQKAGHIYINR